MAFNVLDGMQYIQQQGELGRQRGQDNRLSQLSQQAYGATGADRQSALGQMEGVRPGTGMAYGDKMQSQDDDKAKRYGGAAKYLKSAIKSGNPAAIAGAYRATVPAFQELSPDKQFPAEYDPTMLEPMSQAMEQIIAASEGVGADKMSDSASMREFNSMTQGMSSDDVMKARRVNLGLDGRASTSGFSQVKFTDGQGRERIGVLNGRTGVIDLPDGTSFNPQTGQSAPTQQMAPQQGPQSGTPFTIDPSLPPNVQASIRNNEMQWANAPDQSAAQLPPQHVAAVNGGDPFTSRSAEDQAGRTVAAQEQAKINAEMGNYRDMTALQAEREGATTTARGVATAQVAQQYGSDKPMPVGALKANLEVEDALGAAKGVMTMLAKHLGRIGKGELKVSQVGKLGAKTRTFLNSANPNDVNYNNLIADRQQIVNDSLILNKGVQTEGDAQRAVLAIMSSEDQASTVAAMKRLVEINVRAIAMQKRKRALIESNYKDKSAPQAPSDDAVDSLLELYP